MASLYDSASLVMIPSGVKDGKAYSIKPTDGSGDFTFSRGTDTATRVNASGLIEKERSNQLLNSVWSGVGSNVAPTNYAITSFASGTFNAGSQANSIRFTSPTTADRIMITQAPSVTGVIVGSVYVEEIHSGSINVADVVARTSGSSSVIAYLENGVVVNDTDPVSAGNTYAIVINVTTAVTFRFGVGTSGPTAADVTLSKPQVEYGLVNTDYIATTSAAVYEGITDNLPRLDYSGGASCPSLLLEPSRTNGVPYSEYFNAWTKVNVNITDNAITSPEGVVNAAKITPDTTNSFHYLNTDSVNINNNGTASIYAKADGYNKIGLRSYLDGRYAIFNINDGTLGGYTTASASIEDAGDGWYRCSLNENVTSSYGLQVFVMEDGATNPTATYQGDDIKSVYLYGAQVEAGNYPTSIYTDLWNGCESCG